MVKLDGHVDLWIDDEGLYRKDQVFFSLGDDPRRQLIAGRALVLGRDDWETTEAPSYITVEHLNDVIHWYGDAHEAEAAIGLGLVERPYSAINGEVIWQWSPDQVDGWI